MGRKERDLCQMEPEIAAFRKTPPNDNGMPSISTFASAVASDSINKGRVSLERLSFKLASEKGTGTFYSAALAKLSQSPAILKLLLVSIRYAASHFWKIAGR